MHLRPTCLPSTQQGRWMMRCTLMRRDVLDLRQLRTLYEGLYKSQFLPHSVRAMHNSNFLQDGPIRIEVRKVSVPPHRMTPLKATWPKIYPPLVEHLKLQVRMNVRSKAVELRTSKLTTDTGAVQKGADFVQAFCLGFDVEDSIALLRLDDLYIETFESTYLSSLAQEHLNKLHRGLITKKTPAVEYLLTFKHSQRCQNPTRRASWSCYRSNCWKRRQDEVRN